MKRLKLGLLDYIKNGEQVSQPNVFYFYPITKRKVFIIHGTVDDNVHFQNSTQMVTALIIGYRKLRKRKYR